MLTLRNVVKHARQGVTSTIMFVTRVKLGSTHRLGLQRVLPPALLGMVLMLLCQCSSMFSSCLILLEVCANSE
jgi:hypothetical protein